MNQKLAKKLRKIAIQMATVELSYTEANNIKPEIRKNEAMAGGFEIVQVKYQGTIRAHEQSARAIYQRLKKNAKRA